MQIGREFYLRTGLVFVREERPFNPRFHRTAGFAVRAVKRQTLAVGVSL